MACTTGCPTQNCESYAACLRGKAPKVAYCNSAGGWDATTQKKWDAGLESYRDARKQGLQPSSTRPADVERAHRISDATGVAYQAG